MYNVQYAKPQGTKKRVWYKGTDTLAEGYALCYDFNNVNNYQNVAATAITEATYAASRRLVVEKPRELNKIHFAGVVAAESDGKSTGWITIWLPGSVCNVYAYSDCDYESAVSAPSGELLTFVCNKYYFMGGSGPELGFTGEGSAVVLQDVDRSSTPGLVMTQLQEGEPSCGINVVDVLSTATAGALSVSLSAVPCWAGVYAFSADSVDYFYPEQTANDFAAAASMVLSAAAGNWTGQKVKLIMLDVPSTAGISVQVEDLVTGMGSTCSHQVASAYVDLSAANEYFMATFDGVAWTQLTGHDTLIIVS